jgi:hypothetical protein
LLVRRTSPVFPGHTGRDLLASDDAVVDETVNGRWCAPSAVAARLMVKKSPVY